MNDSTQLEEIYRSSRRGPGPVFSLSFSFFFLFLITSYSAQALALRGRVSARCGLLWGRQGTSLCPMSPSVGFNVATLRRQLRSFYRACVLTITRSVLDRIAGNAGDLGQRTRMLPCNLRRSAPLLLRCDSATAAFRTTCFGPRQREAGIHLRSATPIVHYQVGRR